MQSGPSTEKKERMNEASKLQTGRQAAKVTRSCQTDGPKERERVGGQASKVKAGKEERLPGGYSNSLFLQGLKGQECSE